MSGPPEEAHLSMRRFHLRLLKKPEKSSTQGVPQPCESVIPLLALSVDRQVKFLRHLFMGPAPEVVHFEHESGNGVFRLELAQQLV
jgi:hypothetical protein